MTRVMSAVSFDDLVQILTDDQPPRVWSLLVTIFGDLAKDKHAEVSGALLGQMMSAIGIKPEATRVALHRLKKEGWITSHRVGRGSNYMLTNWGRGQSVAASPRIYTTRPLAEHAWLQILPTSADPAKDTASGTQIAPNLLVTTLYNEKDAFSIQLDPSMDVPAWMRNKLCDRDLLKLCDQVAHQFTTFAACLPKAQELTALECATLRVLVVHSWRRVALRTPTLPDHLFPTAWRGAETRHLAAKLLVELPAPSLAELS